jgi:hypothetical protein
MSGHEYNECALLVGQLDRHREEHYSDDSLLPNEKDSHTPYSGTNGLSLTRLELDQSDAHK